MGRDDATLVKSSSGAKLWAHPSAAVRLQSSWLFYPARSSSDGIIEKCQKRKIIYRGERTMKKMRQTGGSLGIGTFS